MMNSLPPIEREIIPGATNLYFVFGGIALGFAMPPFEFYNSAKIIQENKIFMRDVFQCWYHNGLPGISTDIFSTSEFIRNEVEKYQPQKVFFVGNSMGGYAAIFYAALTGLGEAIAFSTRTSINPFRLLIIRDFRSREQLLKAYKYGLKNKNVVWDLKPIILNRKKENKISIFVAKENRLDFIHAQHLRNLPNVSINEIPGSGHNIVKFLRDEGKLPEIMTGKYNK